MMTRKLRPYQIKALDTLKKHNKGICVLPTGAGKTVIFMEDVKQRIASNSTPLTIVIVAPKILLASQLASEFGTYLSEFSNVYYSHVHSGEDGTTDAPLIKVTAALIQKLNYHHLIFTTYKSLPRIHEAEISIDLAIFDEAHHSVLESNFVGVAQTSQVSKNTFFYTATPKHTQTKTTMSNSTVYGGTILSLPPKELVSNGYILPPKVQIKKFDMSQSKDLSIGVDSDIIIDVIDEIHKSKVLICAKSARQISDLISETNFIEQLKDRNFSYMYITSKTGAIIDGVKVTREVFFNTLNEWGINPNKKFVVMHISILSEGISINGLETVIFLRNMNSIEMTQNIGRVLRKDGPNKNFGLCVVPVYSKTGIATEKSLHSLIENMFS